MTRNHTGRSGCHSLLFRQFSRGFIALTALVTQHAAANNDGDLYALSLKELTDTRVSFVSLLPTSQLEAGSSVDVVTPAQWQHEGAQRTLDAVSHSPATQVLPMHIGSQALAVRGYGSVNALSGTSMQWDGVPLNDLYLGSAFINLPDINLATLDSIELIRGPGSALFGSDAFHGVLALKGFESERDKKQLSASYGSNDFYSVDTRMSAQATANTRLHLAAATSGQGDQEQHFHYTDPFTQQLEMGERKNRYNASTATLKLSSNAENRWSYGGGVYLHDYEASDFSGLGTAVSGSDDLGSTNNRFGMAQFHLTHRFAKASTELQTYYWQMNTDATTHIITPDLRHLTRDAPRDQNRQGVRLTYRYEDGLRYQGNGNPLGTRFALAAGTDEIAISSASIHTYNVQTQVLDTQPNAADGAERTISYLIFEAETRWNDDRWRIIYGGRYDAYSDVGDHTSPRFGLLYFPQVDTAIKLLYGNAFRAPSALELHGSSVVRGNADLAPETLDSYELVIMQQRPQWRWQGEIFHSLWQDAIVAAVAPDDATGFQYANVDRSNATGITLDAERSFASWLLGGTLSWVQSENQTTHADYGMYPRYMMDLRMGYEFHRYAADVMLNQRYYSRVDDVLPVEAGIPAQRLPAYWRTDLTLTQHLQRDLDLTAAARNLFDRQNNLPSPLGSRGGIPDERFNLTVGIRYSY